MLRSLDATNAVEKGVRIDGDAVVKADDDGSKKQLERNLLKTILSIRI